MRDHRSNGLSASKWVSRFLGGATAAGSVLDVACGSGRHIGLCLQAGLRVVGVDRDLKSASRFAGEARVELIEADLENGAPPPFSGRRFAAVIVTNYLWRPLMPEVLAAVADDGVLIYETFASGQEGLGRPSNPEFLLRPGELLETVRGHLVPIAYEHVRLDDPARIVQRICAVGRQHNWIVSGGPAG